MTIAYTPRSADADPPTSSSPAVRPSALGSAVLGFGLRGLATLALAGLAWGLWPVSEREVPIRKQVSEVQLRLAAGQAVTLGRHALAAPEAELDHARIWRDTQGKPWISNLSSHKGLLAIWPDDSERPVRSLVLAAGQGLRVAGEPWQVLATEPQLRLQGPQGQQVAYDGVRVSQADAQGAWQVQPPVCPDVATLEQWGRRLNQAVPTALARSVPLRWGGQAACGQRVPHPRLWPDALRIQREPAGYVLTGMAAAARQVCLSATECPQTLYEQAMPLEGLSRVVIGRTHFAVQWNAQEGLLRLRSVARGGWLPDDVGPPHLNAVLWPGGQAVAETGSLTHKVLSWQTQNSQPWAWPGDTWRPGHWAAWCAWGAAVAVLLALGLRLARHGQWRYGVAPWRTGLWLLLLVWLAGAVGAYRGGASWGVGVVVALAIAALLTVPWWPIRRGWCWFSLCLMAALQLTGLAQQWHMGLQGVDGGGLAAAQRTAAVLCLQAGVMLAVALLIDHLAQQPEGQTWGMQPRRWPYERGLLAMTLLALAGLLLQALVGNELGVAGLQPIELAKAATVMWSAHALAQRMSWQRAAGLWHSLQLWWRLGLPVVLFLGVVGLALLLVHDWSPLLLMAAWAVAALAAWATARRSLWAALCWGLAMACVVAGMFWLRGPGLAWMQDHGFYAERFAVWLQPLLHPHSGEQLLRALQVAVQGGWWGEPGVAAARIPAVHSDMAPAFFVGRHGLAGALGLWAAQMAFTFSLLALGWQALCAVRPGDAQRTWGLRVVFFSAWGAAGMYTAHWLLAWGTNTSLTPVMGQPAPFLAVGNSVMLGFALPLQLLFMVQPPLSHEAVPGKSVSSAGGTGTRTGS